MPNEREAISNIIRSLSKKEELNQLSETIEAKKNEEISYLIQASTDKKEPGDINIEETSELTGIDALKYLYGKVAKEPKIERDKNTSQLYNNMESMYTAIDEQYSIALSKMLSIDSPKKAEELFTAAAGDGAKRRDGKTWDKIDPALSEEELKPVKDIITYTSKAYQMYDIVMAKERLKEGRQTDYDVAVLNRFAQQDRLHDGIWENVAKALFKAIPIAEQYGVKDYLKPGASDLERGEVYEAIGWLKSKRGQYLIEKASRDYGLRDRTQKLSDHEAYGLAQATNNVLNSFSKVQEYTAQALDLNDDERRHDEAFYYSLPSVMRDSYSAVPANDGEPFSEYLTSESTARVYTILGRLNPALKSPTLANKTFKAAFINSTKELNPEFDISAVASMGWENIARAINKGQTNINGVVIPTKEQLQQEYISYSLNEPGFTKETSAKVMRYIEEGKIIKAKDLLKESSGDIPDYSFEDLYKREDVDYGEAAMSGLYGTVGSVFYGAPRWIADSAYWLASQPLNALYDAIGKPEWKTTTLEKTFPEYKKVIQKILPAEVMYGQADKYSQTKEFNGDILQYAKAGNWAAVGQLIGVGVVENAPQLVGYAALTAASGGVALGATALGAGAGARKYYDLDKSFSELDEGIKIANSIFTGAAELATERYLGTGRILERILKTPGAKDAVKKSLVTSVKEAFKGFWEEGLEEVVAQLSENVADTFSGIKDGSIARNVFGGVLDAFIIGAVSGFGLGGGGTYMRLSQIKGATKAAEASRKQELNNPKTNVTTKEEYDKVPVGTPFKIRGYSAIKLENGDAAPYLVEIGSMEEAAALSPGTFFELDGQKHLKKLDGDIVLFSNIVIPEKQGVVEQAAKPPVSVKEESQRFQGATGLNDEAFKAEVQHGVETANDVLSGEVIELEQSDHSKETIELVMTNAERKLTRARNAGEATAIGVNGELLSAGESGGIAEAFDIDGNVIDRGRFEGRDNADQNAWLDMGGIYLDNDVDAVRIMRPMTKEQQSSLRRYLKTKEDYMVEIVDTDGNVVETVYYAKGTAPSEAIRNIALHFKGGEVEISTEETIPATEEAENVAEESAKESAIKEEATPTEEEVTQEAGEEEKLEQEKAPEHGVITKKFKYDKEDMSWSGEIDGKKYRIFRDTNWYSRGAWYDNASIGSLYSSNIPIGYTKEEAIEYLRNQSRKSYTKMYRVTGDNVAAGENKAFTWVAEDRAVAENYAGVDGVVEEIEVRKPSNPYKFPFNPKTYVKAENIGNVLRAELAAAIKSKKVKGQKNINLLKKHIKAIEFYTNNEGKLELYLAKVNNNKSNHILKDLLIALGYDGILVEEGHSSVSPMTNTYAIFKEEVAQQRTVAGHTYTELTQIEAYDIDYERSQESWFKDNVDELQTQTIDSKEVKSAYDAQQLIFLTGERPYNATLTEEDNKELYNRAKKWLEENQEAGDYQFYEVVGRYGSGEHSFMVIGMTIEDIKRFLAEFQQEAAATGYGMLYQDDMVNPRETSYDQYAESIEANPNYVSAIKTTNGKEIMMSYGYDFDTKRPLEKAPATPIEKNAALVAADGVISNMDEDTQETANVAKIAMMNDARGMIPANIIINSAISTLTNVDGYSQRGADDGFIEIEFDSESTEAFSYGNKDMDDINKRQKVYKIISVKPKNKDEALKQDVLWRNTLGKKKKTKAKKRLTAWQSVRAAVNDFLSNPASVVNSFAPEVVDKAREMFMRRDLIAGMFIKECMPFVDMMNKLEKTHPDAAQSITRMLWNENEEIALDLVREHVGEEGVAAVVQAREAFDAAHQYALGVYPNLNKRDFYFPRYVSDYIGLKKVVYEHLLRDHGMSEAEIQGIANTFDAKLANIDPKGMGKNISNEDKARIFEEYIKKEILGRRDRHGVPGSTHTNKRVIELITPDMMPYYHGIQKSIDSYFRSMASAIEARKFLMGVYYSRNGQQLPDEKKAGVILEEYVNGYTPLLEELKRQYKLKPAVIEYIMFNLMAGAPKNAEILIKRYAGNEAHKKWREARQAYMKARKDIDEQKLREQMLDDVKSIFGDNSEALLETYDIAIGNVMAGLIADESFDGYQFDRIENMIRTMFGKKYLGKGLGAFVNIGYASILGQFPKSGIRQLGDNGMAMFFNGALRTMGTNMKILRKKLGDKFVDDAIKTAKNKLYTEIEDLMGDVSVYEKLISDGNVDLSATTSRLLKFSGLSIIDNYFSHSIIEGHAENLKDLFSRMEVDENNVAQIAVGKKRILVVNLKESAAKRGFFDIQGYKKEKMLREVYRILGDSFRTIGEQIRNGNFDSMKAKQLLYNQISNAKPTSVLEQPAKKTQNEWLSLMYQLKTFQLKSIYDVWRQQIFREIHQGIKNKNAAQVANGLVNGAKFVTYMTMSNATANFMIDVIMNRPLEEYDIVLDALLELIGVSRYAGFTISKQIERGMSPQEAVMRVIAPPAWNISIDTYQSVRRSVKNKENILQSKFWKYIPPFGALYEAWLGETAMKYGRNPELAKKWNNYLNKNKKKTPSGSVLHR